VHVQMLSQPNDNGVAELDHATLLGETGSWGTHNYYQHRRSF
jgi:hypothetical protein